MDLLLDTHALLWFFQGNDNLSANAKSKILEPKNEIIVSVASLWEIAIKTSRNKLHFTMPIVKLHTLLIEQNFQIIGIVARHLEIIETLPYYHKDPFDRLLVAQAQHHNYTLISKDAVLDAYGIQRIW